ncbi:MAG: DNA polymerase/3'-5' exonuclease PolX [Gammaproteobacteria bacterium]|nr:MAG: DNA polymerase/3'-5' exonuclease PolX [Gammaproteobacteria bacterium]
MPIHNTDIARIFDEVADLLEIKGENPFRIRAYRNAARQLQSMGVEVRTMLEKNEDLTELPGIGKDLAAKIQEIVETGTCHALKKLQQELPPSLTDLLRIPALGPRRVKVLYHDLDIHGLEQLYRAARDGRIRELPGFGEKIEAAIMQAIETHVEQQGRFKLATAAQYAEPLVRYLERVPGVNRVVIAGSYRRCRETVGDLDILVTARRGSPIMDRFVEYDEVKEILSKGNTRASVRLHSGLQVDVRVVKQNSFGAALHYFTGSKAHNIAIRRLGQQRKLKINEYGVFRGDKRLFGDTEASVFKSVGLPYIPPELRENRGEIEAARADRLPKLVELGDLKGDLHAHTKATDGHHSLKEMAEAARTHGLTYLAITEHSRRLTVAHGLDPQRLRKQIDEIDRLNEQLKGVTLLKGVEVDILEDGNLDLPDSILGELDLVVGAVHSKFNLARAKQTERILRAMDHPHFTIFAHPTGRLLEQREPYDVDMLHIIRKAKQRGCYLELNAHPQRLDLLDVHCQMAKEEGVLVAISSDAHSVQGFDNLIYGVGQARRGWLEKDDVLNTRSLKVLRSLLRRTM